MSVFVKDLIEQANGKPLVGEYVHVLVERKRRTLEIVGVRDHSPRAIYVAGDKGRLSLAENTRVDLQVNPFSREATLHGDTLI